MAVEAGTPRLGLHLGSQAAADPVHGAEIASVADDLGIDSIWVSEAYGADCVAPLAWFGARTSAVRLGTGIMQMSARTPAATAMTAASMNRLSGGRFVLGLGVSGPQVVEGWHGQAFQRPLARTREYVALVRAALRRERPLVSDGPHYPLPLPGGTGLGKPLRLSLDPGGEVPIVLAAEGPKNIALAAEIADGWMPFFYSPRFDGEYREMVEVGLDRRPGGAASPFEVVARVHVAVDDSVEAAADKVRPTLALYIGGMGAREANFHANVFRRMGYEREVDEVQRLYLEGDRAGAQAAITLAMVEEVALVGPLARIREGVDRWRSSMLDVMLVDAPVEVVTALAEELA